MYLYAAHMLSATIALERRCPEQLFPIGTIEDMLEAASDGRGAQIYNSRRLIDGDKAGTHGKK